MLSASLEEESYQVRTDDCRCTNVKRFLMPLWVGEQQAAMGCFLQLDQAFCTSAERQRTLTCSRAISP